MTKEVSLSPVEREEIARFSRMESVEGAFNGLVSVCVGLANLEENRMKMFKVDEETLKRHGFETTDDLYLEKDEVSVNEDFCVVNRSVIETFIQSILHLESVYEMFGTDRSIKSKFDEINRNLLKLLR